MRAAHHAPELELKIVMAHKVFHAHFSDVPCPLADVLWCHAVRRAHCVQGFGKPSAAVGGRTLLTALPREGCLRWLRCKSRL